jgi:hypothetical protein
LTTSVRALGGGHLSAAVRAAPLGLVVFAVAIVALVGLMPKRIRLPIPLLVAVVTAEWAFELIRFHVL